MLERIGIFFLLIGVALIGLFVISDQAYSPHYALLFSGFLLMLLGGILFRKNRTPPPSSERFRTIRSLNSREKKSKKRKNRKQDQDNEN